LNTELDQPSGFVSASDVSVMSGVAYHLEGGIIADVQYRIDGGSWRSVDALDGAFDSDFESFILEIDSLEAGAYLIQARAIDGNGNIEINFANQQVTVAYTAFLPVVMGGM